jgi:hypothetical protein
MSIGTLRLTLAIAKQRKPEGAGHGWLIDKSGIHWPGEYGLEYRQMPNEREL